MTEPMSATGRDEVLAAIAGAPNIRVLDGEMSRAELWALTAQSNAFVSLHRAEGVGLALAEAMGLGVVAEGVETAAQFEFLKAEGCRGFQGFYFGRPAPLALPQPAA